MRWLRWRLTWNTIASLLTGSRLRLSMILICSLIFWVGLFALFLGGFEFIGLSDELFHAIFEYLFSMFFLSISIMLFFSTGIITYTGLFHSREGAFLLTTPATTDRIFAYKFGEAVVISSWGFFLLGSPLMAAYGTDDQGARRLLCHVSDLPGDVRADRGELGAIVAIVVANVFPKRQKGVLAAGVITIVFLFAALAVRLWRTPGDTLTSDWLGNVQNRLAFCQHPLWPSRWMSAGLLASARGEWSRAGYYLLILSAHAALCLPGRGGRGPRPVFPRIIAACREAAPIAGASGSVHSTWFFHRLFFFVSPPIRLLLLKDLRTFCRDPAQWSQFLIFFGLLAFYFLNIPRLGYGVQSPVLAQPGQLPESLGDGTHPLDVHQPVHLSAALARRPELLGPGPASARRKQILWGKFAFSVGISLLATEGLVFLSDLMLGMGPVMIALHLVMVAVLCAGLSGISVGLGARLPNLRETDPSKIAVGFGGTLNLLVSLVYIFAIVTAMAIPCHLYYLGVEYPGASSLALSHSGVRLGLSAAVLVSLVVGVLGTILPLRIGIKAFEHMEF